MTEPVTELRHEGGLMETEHGWLWMCEDCGEHQTIAYDTMRGAAAALQRHAERTSVRL